MLVRIDSSAQDAQLRGEEARVEALAAEKLALSSQISAAEASLEATARSQELIEQVLVLGLDRATLASALEESELYHLERLHEGQNFTRMSADIEARRLASTARATLTEQTRLKQALRRSAAEEARMRAMEEQAALQVVEAQREFERLDMLGADVSRAKVERARTSMQQARLSAKVAGLESQAAAIRTEEQRLAQSGSGSRAEAAALRAELADERLKRLDRRDAAGRSGWDLEIERARTQSRMKAADALIVEKELQQLTPLFDVERNERTGRVQELRALHARCLGSLATYNASISRLRADIEKATLVAPIDGTIGSAMELYVGEVLLEQQVVATVLPVGSLVVRATFTPDDSLGRIDLADPGVIRLDAFPWTRFGSLTGRVSAVGSEPMNDRLHVEIVLDQEQDFTVALRHGLTGRVEIEVERISPLLLILETAGGLRRRSTPN